MYLGGDQTTQMGTGVLNINDGGSVDVSGTTKLYSTGGISLTGGSLTTRSFDNSPGGNFSHTGGTLVVGGTFNPGTNNYNIDGPDNPRLILQNSATLAPTALAVGDTGRGQLTVQNGSQVTTTQRGYVGLNSTGRGTVVVDGIGSKWTNSADLFVGGTASTPGGYGTLDISDYGIVKVAGMTKLWADSRVVIQSKGMLETGTLDLTLGNFGMINDGMLKADSVVGDLVNSSGVLAPGHSAGMMTISGDYIQGEFATLQIELGGLLSGEFDQLDIGRDTTLDGLLDVSLSGGFSLAMNQYFQIGSLEGDLFGEFSNLADGDLVGTYGGIDLFIDYSRGGSANGFGLFTSVPDPSLSF